MSAHDAWRLEVEADDELVYSYAPTREAINAKREACADLPAAIDYWDDERAEWVEVLSYRDRELWEYEAEDEEDDKLLSPRALVGLLAVAVACAAIGVAWYAESPGVASYNASLLLLMPLLMVVLWWLQRRLSVRLQWILAGVAAAIGVGGYAVARDAQWWNWGQFAITPLCLLTLALDDDDDDEDREPRPLIMGDGPWGPP